MTPHVPSRVLPPRGLPVALVGLAVLPGALLAIDPAGWFPFGPARWWIVSTLGVLALAGVLLRADPLRIERRVVAAWAIVLTVLAVAAAWGVDGRYAWIGTPERRLGWATWLLFAVMHLVGRNLDPAAVRRGLRLLLPATAIVLGGVAVAQAVGVRPGPFALGGSRPGSTLGSPALLGSAAVLLLPTVIGLVIEARHRGRRVETVLGAVGSVLLVLALLTSGTRGAWFGLVVALAVVAGWRRRGRETVGSGRRRGTGGDLTDGEREGDDEGRAVPTRRIVGAAVVAIAIALLAVVPNPVGDRIASLTDRDAPGGLTRLDEWRVATRMIGSNPILGVGPEGYRIAFPTAVDDAYERAHGRDPLPDRAHSAPLDVATSGGLLGLAAWLGLWAVVGRRVLARIRAGDAVDVGLGTGILAALAASFVLFPTMEVDVVLWLFVGLLLGSAVPATASTSPSASVHTSSATAFAASVAASASRSASVSLSGSAPATAGSSRWLRGVPLRRVAMAVPIVLLAFVVFVSGLVGVLADRRAADAVAALRRGDDAVALGAATRAVDLRPDVLRHHLLLARVRIATNGGHRAAVADLDRAATWSPRDPVLRLARVRALVDLAEATRLPADLERAADAVGELLAADPSLTEGWLLSERLGWMRGRPDQVRVAIERSTDLGADGDRGVGPGEPSP